MKVALIHKHLLFLQQSEWLTYLMVTFHSQSHGIAAIDLVWELISIKPSPPVLAQTWTRGNERTLQRHMCSFFFSFSTLGGISLFTTDNYAGVGTSPLADLCCFLLVARMVKDTNDSWEFFLTYIHILYPLHFQCHHLPPSPPVGTHYWSTTYFKTPGIYTSVD